MSADRFDVLALRASHRAAADAVLHHATRLREIADAVLRGDSLHGEGLATQHAARMEAATARRDALVEALAALDPPRRP